nr:VF530 family protein [Thiomicrorhabdus cannonii]
MEQSASQRNNPLHGITLKIIVSELHDYYGGWQGLAQKAPMNCFKNNPTLKSALTFLRKTPWAREKVEQLYLFTQREIQRRNRTKPGSE